MTTPTRRHRLVPVLVGFVAGLALAACGADDDDGTGAAAPAEDGAATSTSDTTAAGAPAETAPAATAPEGAVATAVPFDDAELITTCLEDPASGSPTPAQPGILTDADGLRYCVGPALQVGIESAAAVVAPFGPAVEPVLTEAGIETFNLLAGECFDPNVGNSSCPTGQIAIVTDGRVLSAPTINAPSFARDQLVISGTFTIEEAQVIADALLAEQVLTIRPVLLVLGPEES